jgi:histidyl-tRNA synthetase
VGAEGLYAFRVNDRAVAEGMGRLAGAQDIGRFFRAVDSYRKVPPAEFEGELEAAGVPKEKAAELARRFQDAGNGVPPRQFEEYAAHLQRDGLDAAALEGVVRLRSLFRLLDHAGLGDRIVFDPTVVRGLAYYTSTVFEAFSKGGDGRSIFGGGRYDHLIELFEGPPTPAAGLAIGDQTLELLLRAGNRWPDGEPPLDTYVVVVDPTHVPEAVRLVEELRRAGVSADADLLGRSMSRQLKEAARRRCRRALLLGLKEAGPDGVVERDLSSGAQRTIPRSEAARRA